jgi:intracellular sulfur oxidation DsrE/DsrF family protein
MNNTVIQITNNGVGNADEKLQHTLMAKYLELLMQNNSLPAAFCFYTAGVKLVCEGSPVTEHLRSFEEKGVHLIVCSTCLNYYELNKKLKIGIVGGMGDIIEAQAKADKVISI